MSRRRFFCKRTLVEHVMRYYSSSGIIVQADWVSFDLFIVGGGGSGGAWVDWNYGPGGGGAGGECVTIKKLRFPVGTRLDIIIGKGGPGVNTRSGNPGNPGGETTVKINNIPTYVAKGGNAGNAGVPDSNALSKPHWISGAQGYDPRSDAIGIIRTSTSNIYDVHDKSGNILLRNLDTTKNTYNNPYCFQRGVPEFHEEGNITHAAGGASVNHIRALTTGSRNTGEDFQNTNESIWIRGGGGCGGGGAGGYYRNGTSGAGGDGCVVLRYYTYK